LGISGGDSRPLPIEQNTYLKLLRDTIAKLEHAIAKKLTPNIEHAVGNLAGYKEVLETNSEDTAREFFEIKQKARDDGTPFMNNAVVIEHMKSMGLWKVIINASK
jgi:translation initiation factor 2B subunit (eIF-2B alpha/beta/delta family)